MVPAKYERSIRAIAMALHSILIRAGDALPTDRHVIELEVDGEYTEITLEQHPTITVRLPTVPDARIKATGSDISAILLGQSFDTSTFTLVSGDEAIIVHLIAALNWTGSID